MLNQIVFLLTNKTKVSDYKILSSISLVKSFEKLQKQLYIAENEA